MVPRHLVNTCSPQVNVSQMVQALTETDPETLSACHAQGIRFGEHRRVEILANGLPLFGGAQLAVRQVRTVC